MVIVKNLEKSFMFTVYNHNKGLMQDDRYAVKIKGFKFLVLLIKTNVVKRLPDFSLGIVLGANFR